MILCISKSYAQEKKVAKVSNDLYTTIALMDSTLFSYFNSQNFPKFKALFTDDLEWFQDNEGLLNYDKVFINFETMFKRPEKLTRKLVSGSLEIHPLKNYGAIEIGQHKFMHFENGKEEIGTFKFVMLWQLKDGIWKISRVISFDH